MSKLLLLIKQLFIFLCASIFSLSVSSFSPLDPILWPDPNFQQKLTFIKYANFKKPRGAIPFEGTLTKHISIDPSPIEKKYRIISDTLELNKNYKVLNSFSDVDFSFKIKDSIIVPFNRSLISVKDSYWDIQLGVGSVWLDDFGNIRSSMPFALIQKNQNCVHNGVLVFDMTEGGDISNIVYQIASETCSYFKFDLIGSLKVTSIGDIDQQDEVYYEYKNWADSKINVRSIEKVEEHKSLGHLKEVDPVHMTVYGFLDDQTHFRSVCKTRWGNYPYCSEKLLPSYSLSKSLFAALAMSKLEEDYPNIVNEQIQGYVPECKQKKWIGVNFGHALNMATGHFTNKKWYSEDWYLRKNNYSSLYTHKDKIKMACSIFPKKAIPGTKFTYHSSETYILGVAMNNFLKSKKGPQADVYRDLMIPIWKELQLSPATYKTRRTLDSVRQPFAGSGMFLITDDVIKLGKYFLEQRSEVQEGILNKALQNDTENRGLTAIENVLYYNRGFWAKKFRGSTLDCNEDVWIPFMSGYGGITVALMPNNTIYYYFSDNQDFSWDRAAFASNKMKPFCN